MKHLAIITFLFIFANSGYSQSAYGVESEYTTQYGYRYFFDKIDISSGTITQLSQLPIVNYFADTYYTNCKSNYMFIGIDSATNSPNYHYILYEVDSLGTIVNTIPMDTGSTSGYYYVRESYDGSTIYGFRTEPGVGIQIVTIDPTDGSRTVVGSFNSPFAKFCNRITIDNELWYTSYGSNPQGYLYGYLHKVDLNTATHTLIDSSLRHYYRYLHYDCEEDRVYGFRDTMGSSSGIGGSHYFEVDLTTDQVIENGITISSSGLSWDLTRIVWPDGKLTMKIGSTISTFDDNVTGPVYSPQTIPVQTNDVKLWMGPLQNCSAQVFCDESPDGVTEQNSNMSRLYPNPTNDGVLNFTKSFSGVVRVFDLSGKMVYRNSTQFGSKLNLSHLENGLYIIRLTSGSEAQTQRVIISQN